jgi:Neurotransmitter-gated ion-channel ligand binding domain/Neurotransmitter-gated ion-channel transmembrane region
MFGTDKVEIPVKLLLIVALILLAGPTPSLAGSSKSSQPPTASNYHAPPGDQPVEVRVGLYLLNLVALDEVHQTFTCTGYLTEKWKDPRLSFSPREDEPQKHYYHTDDVWFPPLQFDNSAEIRKETSYLLDVTPDGAAEYVVKFAVTLSVNMALRAFPFDSQDLAVYVHPFAGDVDRIMLAIDPDSTGVSPAPYTPLPLWSTGRMSYRIMNESSSAGYKVRTHAIFAMHVKRDSEYYIYKIFLPLVLMVAISWGALWIPPADLNSQLVTSVTTILTLVAFSVAISNVLPPVPYLTFCDMFFLVCFVFVLVSVGEILIVHTWHNRGCAEIAHKIRRATRCLLPLAFVLVIVTFGYLFLR